ncbi:MAG TPA: NnrS family protein, partial [Candidatus Binataceae bacterium]|nr:NnrS family protein [Candidatus Binataceae bacterium]
MATIERTPALPDASASRWRSEPFRIFFPLGVLFAWVGVGHWLAYTTGVTATYSCKLHGSVQMQAFMMAFAAGFLMTAVPRRTQTPPVTRIEIGAMITALVITTIGALYERWTVCEAGYAAMFVILAQFAMRRFFGRAAGRRPPAA